jgi:hypothetical protein
MSAYDHMALVGRPAAWFYNRSPISLKARQVMTDDSESVALRPTVIDGQRQEDDYEVIWRGLPIGRIMKPPGEPHWWWGCNVYGRPLAATEDRDQFRIASFGSRSRGPAESRAYQEDISRSATPRNGPSSNHLR